MSANESCRGSSTSSEIEVYEVTDGMWGTYDSRDGYGPVHVIPEHDLWPHEMSENCCCRPEDDDDNARWILIHNAFDGREDFESGKRSPS
jgi:hypothetical protein